MQKISEWFIKQQPMYFSSPHSVHQSEGRREKNEDSVVFVKKFESYLYSFVNAISFLTTLCWIIWWSKLSFLLDKMESIIIYKNRMEEKEESEERRDDQKDRKDERDRCIWSKLKNNMNEFFLVTTPVKSWPTSKEWIWLIHQVNLVSVSKDRHLWVIKTHLYATRN